MIPQHLTWSCDEVLQRRLLPRVWDEIQTSNSQKDQNARIALVLCALSDHNNNLLNVHDQLNILYGLTDRFVVHIKVINKVEDVENAIKEAGSSLETIYFIGHGSGTLCGQNQGGILLAGNQYFTIAGVKPDLWKNSSLKSIMLGSCLSASLAQAISKATGIPTCGSPGMTERGGVYVYYCKFHEYFELSVIRPATGQQEGVVYEEDSSRAPCELPSDRHPKEAVFLKELIKDGTKDPCPYSVLAFRYFLGNGVPRDLAQTREYYRVAAELGDSYSQSSYGLCWMNGWGGDKSLDQAKIWYEKSAEAGNSCGQYRLGMLYGEESKTLEQSARKEKEKLALYYLNLSIEQNYAPAMLQVAVFRLEIIVGRLKEERDTALSESQQVEGLNEASPLKEIDQAIRMQRTLAYNLLERACNAKDPEALYYVGTLHVTGSEASKYPLSDVEALKYFQQAAALECQESFYSMGLFYKNGRGGLAPSIDKAIDYFAADMMAESEGNPASACELAILYLWKHKHEGSQGLSFTGEQVLQWLEDAAKKDFLPANYLLGLLYSKGEAAYGISPSDEKAKQFFDVVERKRTVLFEGHANKIKKDLGWALGLTQTNEAAVPFPLSSGGGQVDAPGGSNHVNLFSFNDSALR
jgi:TPR repeat protein